MQRFAGAPAALGEFVNGQATRVAAVAMRRKAAKVDFAFPRMAKTMTSSASRSFSATRTLFSRAVFALALGAWPIAAAAETHQPYPLGAPGDAGVTLICDAGSSLVGFVVGKGVWLDNISTICAKPGAPITQDKYSQTYGGTGGSVGRNYRCAVGESLTRIRITPSVSKEDVGFLDLTCVSGAGEHMVFIDGTRGASHSQEQDCLPGEVASGIDLRYGKYVNAIGLRCDAFHPVAPQPASAPAPAPPPAPAPAPPSVPFESNAPLGSANDLAGVWAMTINTTASDILPPHFALTLTINGDSAGGVFTDPNNATHNGTLSGPVTGGRLAFTWVEPANGGATGTGVLKVHTDNTMGGDILFRVGGIHPTMWRWYGTLARRLTPAEQAGMNPNARVATALKGTTVYKTTSGEDISSNKVCAMFAGDKGEVVGTGPDNWVKLANVKNASCTGQGGYVWNEGDLQF